MEHYAIESTTTTTLKHPDSSLLPQTLKHPDSTLLLPTLKHPNSPLLTLKHPATQLSQSTVSNTETAIPFNTSDLMSDDDHNDDDDDDDDGSDGDTVMTMQ